MAHDLGHDLVRQQAAAGFETLANPKERDRRGDRLELFEQAAQSGERAGEDGQRGTVERRGEIRRQAQFRRQGATGEVSRIDPLLRHFVHARRVAAPEHHLVPGSKGDCQRRTPSSGAKYGYAHDEA
jgi:hypothetical protein